jgi:Ca2+-binding RTX toxin-like protein
MRRSLEQWICQLGKKYFGSARQGQSGQSSLPSRRRPIFLGKPVSSKRPKFRGVSFEPLQQRTMFSIAPLPVASAQTSDLQLAAALGKVGSATTVSLASPDSMIAFDPSGSLRLSDESRSSKLTPSIAANALVVTGRDYVDDALSLDLSVLPRGRDGGLKFKTIVYNGGAAGFDTLRLSGGSFQSVRYTPVGRDSGILRYDDLTVVFTGLEPVIDLTDSYELEIDGTSNADDIYIVTGENQWDAENEYWVNTAFVYESHSNFENYTFANKSNIQINGLEGDDSFHFAYTLGPTARIGGFTVSGGPGNDRYIFDPSGNDMSVTLQEDDSSDIDTLDFSAYSSGVSIDLSSSGQGVPNASLFLIGVDPSAQVDAGFENIIGGSGNDILTGNARDNTLTGGSGADILTGGFGDDRLVGGPGNDTLAGGSGSDTYVFNVSAGDLGSDTITEVDGADSDTLDMSSFTSGQNIGSSTAPFNLSISNTAQPVHSGVLVLTLSGSAAIENVIAGAGNDVITGNSRDNFFDGGLGDDTIRGLGGNDVIHGGSGADSLYGDDSCGCFMGADSLYGDSGDDHLFGGPGIDYLDGGSGQDYLDGGDYTPDFIQDRPVVVLNPIVWTGTDYLVSGELHDDAPVSSAMIQFGDALDNRSAMVNDHGYFSLAVGMDDVFGIWVSAWYVDAEGLTSVIATRPIYG